MSDASGTTGTVYTAENAPSWAEIRAMFAEGRAEDERLRNLMRMEQEQRWAQEENRWAQEENRRAQEEKRRALEESRRAREEKSRRAQEENFKAQQEKLRLENEKRREEAIRLHEEESRRLALEAEKRRIADERMLRELGRKIAGLGDKFGYFTEGLALPTMEKILERKFGIESISPRMKFSRNGKNLEFDVFGLSSGLIRRLVVVEVKSRVKFDAIGQLRAQLEAVRELMPEHDDKEAIGILAGVHWDPGVEEQAQSIGFHTARIRDDVFQLSSPGDFAPRHW